jgi:hypothetical protein
MEHSLPFELNEPWRTRAVVAAAIAVLELFVLVIIAVAMISEPVAQRVTHAAEAKVLAPAKKKEAKPKPKPKPRVALPKLSRAETSVTVLNGNGVQGAAAAQAATVRARGYTVGTVTNAPQRGYSGSMVMYRKGFAPEGKRLARDLGLTLATPLDGLSAADLTGSHVALIVGG